MDRERSGEIEYMKPTALDLGALTIVYGVVCPNGPSAQHIECSGGSFAEGGNVPGACQTGGNPNVNCVDGSLPGAT